MKAVLVFLGLALLTATAFLVAQRIQGAQQAESNQTTPALGFTPQVPIEQPTRLEIEAQLPASVYRISVDDPALLARGEVVYRTSCSSCHGANLEGQENWWLRDADGNLPAPPHDQTGHTWHHSDDVLFNLVKYGPAIYVADYSGKMPAYDGVLEDYDIQAVNSWIASTCPEEILLAQRERTLASEQPQ